MTVVRARGAILLAKIDATNGVDPSPIADDAIFCQPFDPAPDLEMIPRPAVNGSFVPLFPLTGYKKDTWTCLVPFKGSGIKDTPPEWSCLLQACGFTETINVGTSVVWTPEPPDKTVTLYYYRGGHCHKLIGSGGSVGYVASPLPMLTFTMTGKYLAPVAEAAVASPVYDTTKAVPGYGVSFTYDSQASKLQAFSIEANAVLDEEINLNDNTGFDFFMVNGHDPTGSLAIRDIPIGTYDYRKEASDDDEYGAWTITHGATVGNILTLSGSVMKLGSYSESTEGGRVVLEFPHVLGDSAAGAKDWLTITQT